MRHTAIFTRMIRHKMAWLLATASVVLLAGAGVRYQGLHTLRYLFVPPPTISATAACHCLNNATNLSNGQFVDTLTIQSNPGETWTIIAPSSGLFLTTSPTPPATPVPIPLGTVIPEASPGSGVYQLVFRHVDSTGFSVTVTNGIDPPLSLSKACYYPNPQILNLPSLLCPTSAPVTLQGTAGAGVAGTGSFTINGAPATVFDPNTRPPGTYVVRYTFDAGAGTPNNPGDPACTAFVEQNVTISNTPWPAGIDFLNVPLNNQCFAKVTPAMTLSDLNAYPCPDDFRVTVFDVPGNPIGDSIGPEWVGFTLRAITTAVNSDYQVYHFITFTDDVRPTIVSCPPEVTQAVVTQSLQTLNGALTVTDSTLALSSHSCFVGQLNPTMGLHRYDRYVFTVSAADTYIFELDPQFGRGVGVLYQGLFNPAFPCMNVIDMADDGVPYISPDSIIRLSANLVPGQTYTLFTSSRTPGALGAYQWRIYSDGPGLINNIAHVMIRDTFDLVCNDHDSIFNNPHSLQYLGAPEFADNCGPVTVTFNDTRQTNGNCGPVIITRTFTARDRSGNTRTCTQTIRVRKPRISDLRFPPASTVIECSVGFQTTPNGNPHPSATGFPYIETAFGIFRINPVFCNLAAAWQDEAKVVDPDNPNVYTFIRRWTVLDECNPADSRTYSQIIRVDDFSPPIISCPMGIDRDGDGILDPPVFSTGNTECTAIVQAMAPIVTDNCSSFTVQIMIVTDLQVPVLGPQGQVLGFNIQTVVLDSLRPGQQPFFQNVPIGNHRFRYIATDSRGNMAQVECPLFVRDEIQPTAVCDDNLIVSIGSNSYGRVFAQDVNEGSTDNCGIAALEVRRYYTQDPETCLNVTPYYSDWGPFIELSCCDVGRRVIVELRVTDVHGNQNVCMAELTVEDKTRPVCMAPPARTISCDSLPQGFSPTDTVMLRSMFGAPQAVDNCIGAYAEELSPIVTLGNCGSGTIVRRFRARDAAGNISSNTCQQVITISLTHNYSIRFPKDASAECGLPEVDTIIVQASRCANMAVSVTNEKYTASEGACYKIFRTYRVINWCEYNGSDEPIVINRDEDCDGQGGDEDVWVLRRSNQTYIDRNNNHADNIPTANTRGIACGSPSNPVGYWRTTPSRGYWQYTQVIKVYDSQQPTASFTPPAPFCAEENSCTAVVSTTFSVTEFCSPNDVSVQVFLDAFSDGVLDGSVNPGQGLLVNYPAYMISGTYPIGNHRFVVNLRDGCGNTNSITIPFAVIDCGAPIPVCINGISRALMPLPPNTDADGDGDFDRSAITLQATDFVLSPAPIDCSGPVRYSINLAGQTPDPTRTALVLTCDNLGTNIIEIYAWDNANNPTRVQPNGMTEGPNYSSCQTFVIVQANAQVSCDVNTLTSGMIAGGIYNEQGNPVEAVNVNLSGYMTQSVQTEPGGQYELEDLPAGEAYTVTPAYNMNAINGVSTFDVILITRHILGTQLLDSPYKLIAADVNNSKSISTLDVIQIRRLILGITNNFPQNSSWRFIDADFTFPNPANPWQTPFPEAIQVSNLQGQLMNRNFIAIKIGDVNNSAIPNSQTVDNRSMAGTFTLYSNELVLEPGKEINVPITARNWQGIAGFQMTIEFDAAKLEFLDVVFGILDTEHIGTTKVEEGMITVSWNRPADFMANANPAAEGETLFWLSFKPKDQGKLEQALAVTSRYTRAEAYDPQGELLGIELKFERTAAHEDRFELYQNVPNPFNGQTMIGFKLPEGDFFSLRVHDASGKVLKEQRGYFEAGYNQIWLHAADIPGSGLLYYTLTSGTHSATRKMVVIKQ